MPTKKCSSKGKSGYQFGASGKCYTGKSGKSKANKQGMAISISKYKMK